jgi:DNA-binding LacI/PurR family transcriptional regulator
MKPVAATYNSKAVRLSERLLEEFSRRNYVAGTRLPAETDLAREYDVSRSTIRRALKILADARHVRRIPQKGVVVADRHADSAQLRQIVMITEVLNDQAEMSLRGMNAGVDRKRFVPTVQSVNANLSQYQAMIENVAALRPAGVILQSTPAELCRISGKCLAEGHIPTVVSGMPVDGLECDRVLHDGGDSGRILGRHIRGKGYRDVAVLMQTPRRSSQAMLNRLQHELSSNGIEVREENVFVYDGRVHGYGEFPDPYVDAYEHMTALFRRGFRCELLVCSHDYPAVAALRAALDAGVKVPQEMKVISGCRRMVAGAAPIPMTTVDTREEEQACLAAELLVRRIDGHDGPPEVHHVSGILVEGDSA